MYVVNYDALYWKERALRAERALDEMCEKYDEAVNLNVQLADTSSRNLLHAILNGAFDKKDSYHSEDHNQGVEKDHQGG